MKRNPCFASLQPSYLFPEVQSRLRAFQAKKPTAQIISLSIGDTTHPIPSSITMVMSDFSTGLSTEKGYCGYGPEQGLHELRSKIAEVIYKGEISPEEVLISDGANCDLARLQFLFPPNCRVAVQDPAYPAYIDTSIIARGLPPLLLPCTPENNFFPDFKNLPSIDLFIICSPHNPTGVTATHEQLERLVSYAKAHRAFILFDAAYSSYVDSDSHPSTIYQIPGAKEVAIEIGSFSKMAGFTGVRLGWSVVPKALLYEEGGCVHQDWNRIQETCFNGASRISQAGGFQMLTREGQEAAQQVIDYYKQNTQMLREALVKKGYRVYGGEHAPFLWVHQGKRSSWEAFQELLETKHLLTIPGSGFGPSGEHFLRFSAFGKRASILEAIERLNA